MLHASHCSRIDETASVTFVHSQHETLVASGFTSACCVRGRALKRQKTEQLSDDLPSRPASCKIDSCILQSETRSRELDESGKTAVNPSNVPFHSAGMGFAKSDTRSYCQLKELIDGPYDLDSRASRPWSSDLGFPVLVRGRL
jgi:hypothetical protein